MTKDRKLTFAALKKRRRNAFIWRKGIVAFGVPFALLYTTLLSLLTSVGSYPWWEKLALFIGLALVGGVGYATAILKRS